MNSTMMRTTLVSISKKVCLKSMPSLAAAMVTI
ncbi:Uncharacterised protein [Vibrio cholerae]|nr:Uncharacterised protein [Vibrio cholerae]